jgi:hypothetical protein
MISSTVRQASTQHTSNSVTRLRSSAGSTTAAQLSQQLVKMSSARASSSQPSSTRPAQRTPEFFHSTTNPLEQHPAKPWSNLKLKTIPGGEGQANSSSPRRWRTRSHSGGEGQATSSWTRRRRASQEQAATHQQEVADQPQDLNIKVFPP